ncbi:DDE domain-containing protein [Nitrosomonas cryotolerans]|uniref:DDE-type integrase/transposase/recombinase n=1 Tax=Nitrosomonas cryotolerans TaxID=44575 RepID=UPI000684DFC3|nr:DDE domain-containing protein [Nitrosomonas cryotolerans]
MSARRCPWWFVSQVKYLDNIVEQDYRVSKRVTKPMLGFESFQSARNILASIELMYMIRKGWVMIDKISFAEQFYALAG